MKERFFSFSVQCEWGPYTHPAHRFVLVPLAAMYVIDHALLPYIFVLDHKNIQNESNGAENATKDLDHWTIWPSNIHILITIYVICISRKWRCPNSEYYRR
jgi:hypothetical protein